VNYWWEPRNKPFLFRSRTTLNQNPYHHKRWKIYFTVLHLSFSIYRLNFGGKGTIRALILKPYCATHIDTKPNIRY
jgi:hypothetical protein